MEARKLTGVWWLPADPETRIAGTLNFTPQERPTLELIGSFEGIQGLARDPEETPLINGVASGKKVTLVECMQIGRQLQLPGNMSETYAPRWILIGDLISEVENLVFRGLSMSFTYLPDWVTRSGFRYSLEEQENKFTKSNLSYEFPNDFSVATDTGSIALKFSLNQSGFISRDHHWKESVYFAIVDAPNSIQDLVGRWVPLLRNLLTLATDQPNQLEWIRIFPVLDQESTSGLDLLFQPPEWRVDTRGRRLLPDEMLFQLTEETDFGSLMTKWLGVSKRLEIPCMLFFGARNTDRMYLDQKFFNFTVAAESFHRHTFSNEVSPRPEHKERVKTIVNAAPIEDRKWLKEALVWSNEPRLRVRIDELIHYTRSSIPIFPSSFSKRVADTRNYNAHYSENLKANAATGEELYYLTEGLGYLLQACFLSELGFDAATIATIMGNNRRFRWAKDKLRALLGGASTDSSPD